MAAYTTEKSKKAFDRALGLVAGGVSSKSRSTFEGYHPYPLFIERAEGSRLYDLDGNEYIDYLVALGATILGNANPEILDFVSGEMRKGSFYALPFELQLEVAEKLIRHVPSFERVSFVNSGTEANQMNIRLARAFTGKNLLLKFEGCYHGWLDNTCFSLSGVSAERLGTPNKPNKIPATGGMAAHAGDDLLTLPWNNVELLEQTIQERKDEIAAVITEPYMCNSGCIPPNDGYLEAMRELTTKNNIVLIFDEVITGFRAGLNCAQGKFGVIPDLTTVGKALGGGFPIAVYGGRKEIMDLIAEDKVLRAGTLNANRMVIAAAYATLGILERNGGQVYDHLYRLGGKLMAGIRDIIDTLGVEAIVQGLGPMFQIYFTKLKKVENSRDSAQSRFKVHHDFIWRLIGRGVFPRPSQMGEFYVTAAHTDKDVEITLGVIEEVLREMRDQNALGGEA
ncbi:MAG: glutamate-1-semialdehyde 2,1-aminomutase [Spirochaetaceae bacterium]|nr:MAG: glutamate-1-semialdehyde 2,1-aminomutase [Spirochaetaceae bacterium]